MARVYQAASMGEAQVRVAIVNDRGQADLLVHRVLAGELTSSDALWFITRNKAEATVSIFPCSIGMAQVRVCFVDNHAEAGWLHSHPCEGAFG